MKAKRQSDVARILSENPYMKHSEIAAILKVSQTTISKDVNEINRTLHNETMIMTFIHRNRLLEEIRRKKRLCSERLAESRGMKGTRWLEEWTKLVEKECKILGIYSPDKRIIAHIDTGKFSKEERDAAVRAALLVEDVIDVDPEPRN